MAYRVAFFGLAATFATTVLASPVPDASTTVVVTIWKDQNGNIVQPTPAPVHAQAYGGGNPWDTGKPLDYSNFQHRKHHQHPAPKPITPVEPVKQPVKEEPVKPVTPIKEEPIKTNPVTTPSNGGGSGMGAGLSVIANSEPIAKTIAGASGGKIGWYHNWQPDVVAGGVPGAQFCPMLHDTWGDGASMWEGLWPAAAAGGFKCYLGQNEPDLTSQDAHAVAQKFTDVFLKGLPSGATIASPSFTSDVNPEKGLGWYGKFETECGKIAGCSYNAIQPHFYGYSASGSFVKGGPGWNAFTKFVGDCKTAAKGKKIWMTEYGLAPDDGGFTDDQRAQFITDATQYLEGQVDAFAPYTVGPGGSNQMTGTSGLGSAYINACK